MSISRIIANNVHMVGIGGIGMSGLAFILREMGYSVSGSDIEENDITKKLRTKGVVVNIGHKKENINDSGLLVYSSSIGPQNSELAAARQKKIPVIPRTRLLGIVMDKSKRSIAVTGTHGKTTITAMAALLTAYAGMEPTFLIGGVLSQLGGNAKLGTGEIVVAEVDESDGRFAALKPTHVIMPNLEREHPEHYKSEKELVNTFKKFIKGLSKKSVFFFFLEDANLRELASCHKGRAVSFGFSDKASVYAKNVAVGISKVQFDAFYRGKRIERFTINIPGVHNSINALAVISLGIDLGINPSVIKKALSDYKGVKRRFEVAGFLNGAKVIEDYAHHPTEIKATIAAAASLKPKRIITVFQPHSYTRTRLFYKEFSSSFGGSSEVILTDVYAASENKLKGGNTENIYDIMSRDGTIPVKFLRKEKISTYLSKNTKEGDLVLILGAGDVNKVAHEVVQK